MARIVGAEASEPSYRPPATIVHWCAGEAGSPASYTELATAIVEAGRAAWPRVQVGVAAMAAHLAGLPSPPSPAHAADVYLAYACARGDAAALAHLEAAVIRQVPAMVRHLGDASFTDEVQQDVRTRLLVTRADRPPRIAAYGGRGSLAGWVRSAALRLALDRRRARPPAAEGARGRDDDRDAGDDPELAYLRAHHREAFEIALYEALEALSPRVRRALRLHVDAGLSAVRIAARMGVNHATVSRWLLAARASVLADTRRRVNRSLRLSAPDFASLAHLLGGALDRGLAPVLAGDDD